MLYLHVAGTTESVHSVLQSLLSLVLL